MSIDSKKTPAWWGLMGLVLALPLDGCLEVQDSKPTGERTCTACHGDDARDGDSLSRSAPPRDLDGHSQETSRGVGAHARHASSDGHAAVACATCHRVPEKVFSPGHVDSTGPAEVILTGLASVAGAKEQAAYDANTGNCANTYCHRGASVQWTSARSRAEVCGSCHGLPPALPHPQSTSCSECHGDVIGPDGKWKSPSRHVDGRVDVRYATNCSACHGSDPKTGAPPPDLSGNLASSARGVGAHAQHLEPSKTHRAIACNECHEVPVEVEAPGHIDGDNRAEVTFGALASARGKAPRFDATTVTCTNTYCHGSTPSQWQAPRSSDEACGSCHGLPPPAPHVQSTQCASCHGRVVGPTGAIIEPSLHVNGSVEVDLADNCSACHGTGPSGAPPPDLQGNVAPTARGVGAHAAHLTASSTHGVVACGECHSVPSVVGEASHLDGDGRAEVTFGTIAGGSGHRPSYDTATLRCADTYCHRAAQPTWQAPRDSAAACGSCHALPPPAPHPVATDCSQCHGTVIDAARRFVAPERHVDGRIDLGPVSCSGCHGMPPPAPHPQTTACSRCHGAVVNADLGFVAPTLHANGRVELDPMPCNACHGTDSKGTPPPDLAGEVAITSRGVGAHALHVGASATHAPIACSECHVVPTSWNSVGHIDGSAPADVTFGPLASVNAMAPRYSALDGTCAGNYCHGGTIATWTSPRADACGSCHGIPPALPHPQNSACAACHGDVVDTARNFVRPELHVDGTVQIVQSCTTCHGSASNAAPPADVSGNSDPSRIGVGAHQLHLSGGRFGRPLACNECHAVPANVGTPGHLDLGGATPADVGIGGPGAAHGQIAAWDRSIGTCQGSWCHGPMDPFNRSPSWVGATGNATCTSCHGMPPSAPHPSDSRCSRCHLGVDAQNLVTDRNLHVNGDVDLL